MQSISTIGNATLIAYDHGDPILSTDPWFGDEDDAYFGSWTLSHEFPFRYKQDVLDSFLDKSVNMLNRFLTNRESRSRRLLKSIYYKIK